MAPASVAAHTRMIENIEPPSGMITLVETMAKYVSENGSEFEQRVIAYNANDDKLSFLRSSDPYHAYYQHKVAEYRAEDDDSEAESEVDDSEAHEREVESVQMDMIDCVDFEEAVSVDFSDEEDEHLPLPMTLDDVIRQTLDDPALIPEGQSDRNSLVDAGKYF